MQLEISGRGSKRFTEMGRSEKNVGIKENCPRVSISNYGLKKYFHGGQPAKYIYFKVIFSILCIPCWLVV